MQKTLEFPADRVKRLTASYDACADLPRETVQREIARALAMEIAEKLVEFNKVSVEDIGDGLNRYVAEIDVVVPPTPKHHI